MKKIKKLILPAIFALASFGTSHAAITISGAVLSNNPGISVGDTAVFISASSIGSLSINENLSTTASSTYTGFTVIGSTSVTADFFGSGYEVTSGTPAGLANNTIATPGDLFAVVVFASSTTSTVANDTFSVFTDSSFEIPADGNTTTFSSAFTGSASQVGTVVPEPSTYAMLAGALALGYVMIRRRK